MFHFYGKGQHIHSMKPETYLTILTLIIKETTSTTSLLESFRPILVSIKHRAEEDGRAVKVPPVIEIAENNLSNDVFQVKFHLLLIFLS